MPSTETTKIPDPVYAAAGAGDLAIERLRKLPAKVITLQDRVSTLQDELPGRVTVLQDKLTQKVAELPALVAELRQRFVDADADKLRSSAKRNAHVVMTNAQAAQHKAAEIYAELVARGEQVIGRNAQASRDTKKVVAEVVPAPEAPAVTASDTDVLDATVITEDAPAKGPGRTRKPRA